MSYPIANHDFDDYISNWGDYQGFKVRFLDQYNDYTGDEIDFPGNTLQQVLLLLDQNPRLEYNQAEITTLDDNDVVLYWDGNAWDWDRN